MSTSQITIVCGFGRCGTSLVMQMLDAGGMPVHDSWPAYEDTEAHGSNRTLMDTLPGKAVKMLDHQLSSLTGAHAYDFIWLDRDEREQAKSALKLMATFGYPVDAGAVKTMARSYAKDRPRTLARLRSFPGARMMRLRFEHIVACPFEAAQSLVNFVGLALDRKAMERQVRPRSTQCLPGLLELELLASLENSGGAA